jgi:protein SCO1/2
MKGMARIQDGFVRMEIHGIRLVSFSVDPGHDTPEVLRAYAKELGADPAVWTLLTGDPERVHELVIDGFKVPRGAVPGATSGPEDVAHAGKVVLVDGSGRIRGYYGTDETGLDEVYNRAQHVLRQQKALLN